MKRVQAVKKRLAFNILANSVYTPKSDAWLRVYNRLLGLSKDDLEVLELIVETRIRNAVSEAVPPPPLAGD